MISENALENTHGWEFFIKAADLYPDTLLRENSIAPDFKGLFRNFPHLFLRERLDSCFWVLTKGRHKSCTGFIAIFEVT